MTGRSSVGAGRGSLERYAWLAIAAALATIGLKTSAWLVTDSVGLLSDAVESLVNLVAAIAALVALRVAARPADQTHHFGHAKAEYFSAAIEGAMIAVAALVIIWQSVLRLLDPSPLEEVGVGLTISVIASVLNAAVAVILIRAGRRHRSITLRADGRHLMTDVVTSVGVVLGVGLVWLSGLEWLDPVVALVVAANILLAGWQLLRESSEGLMDSPVDEVTTEQIIAVLTDHSSEQVHFHGLSTRVSGHRMFAQVHMLVPGRWSVRESHDRLEEIDQALLEAIPELTMSIHLEPREDPRSYDDYETEVPIHGPDQVAGPPAEGKTT